MPPPGKGHDVPQLPRHDGRKAFDARARPPAFRDDARRRDPRRLEERRGVSTRSICASPARDARAIVPSMSTWRPTRPSFYRTITKTGCGPAMPTRWVGFTAGRASRRIAPGIANAMAQLPGAKASRRNRAAARAASFRTRDLQGTGSKDAERATRASPKSFSGPILSITTFIPK